MNLKGIALDELRFRLFDLLHTSFEEQGIRLVPGAVPRLHLHGDAVRRAGLAGHFLRPVLGEIQQHIVRELLDELVPGSTESRWIRRVACLLSHPLLGRVIAETLIPAWGTSMWSELSALSRAGKASPGLAGLVVAAGDLEVWGQQHFGCSTIATRGFDGQLLLGRNLDFDAFGLADASSLLIVNSPQPGGTGEIPTAVLGWVGVWGAFTGWNQRGLCLGNMVVYNALPKYRARLRPWTRQVPMGIAYQTVLRSCGDCREAIRWFENNEPMAASQILLGDASGEACIVEWAPSKACRVRRFEDKALFATNHFIASPFGSEGVYCTREETFRDHFRDNARQLVSSIKSLLHSVSQGELTLHSVIFEPQAGKIHIANGNPPATAGPWHQLGLDVWKK